MAESKSLIALSKQIVTIENCLIEEEGELSPELEDVLDLAQGQLAEKIDGYAAIFDRLDLTEEYIKKQIEAYKDALKRVERGRDNLESRLRLAMATIGTDHLSGHQFEFVEREGRGRVEIVDESALDKHYQRVSYAPDKKRIGDDLKAGMLVHGAILVKDKSIKRKLKL